jgi:hypothetical protein
VKEPVDADTSAMVLTLDSFLTFGDELRAKIIEEATSLAINDQNIEAEDRRHIIFCPIESLEEILTISTEDDLLATLKAARDEKYVGWRLREIHRNATARMETIEPKKYPFDLAGLLPWWTRFDEFKEVKDVE